MNSKKAAAIFIYLMTCFKNHTYAFVLDGHADIRRSVIPITGAGLVVAILDDDSESQYGSSSLGNRFNGGVYELPLDVSNFRLGTGFGSIQNPVIGIRPIPGFRGSGLGRGIIALQIARQLRGLGTPVVTGIQIAQVIGDLNNQQKIGGFGIQQALRSIRLQQALGGNAHGSLHRRVRLLEALMGIRRGIRFINRGIPLQGSLSENIELSYLPQSSEKLHIIL